MKSIFHAIGLGIVLTILGFFVRFYSLESPKEVVFDEFFFFHFVSDYEQNNYFFDIHPPLGKLLLWQNSKFFGIEEYGEKIKEDQKFRSTFGKNSLVLQKEIKTLKNVLKNSEIFSNNSLNNNSEISEKIETLEKKYDEMYDKYQKIQSTPLEKYTIGTQYDDRLEISGIRGFAAFWGVLLIPLVFAFVYLFTNSLSASFFSGILILFSPALTVESQYVLMDSFLLFVMMAGMYALFRYKKASSFFAEWKWWGVASLLTGFAISTKWTGVSVLAIAGVILLIKTLKNGDWKQFFFKGFFIWGVVLATYVSTFFVHFAVLSHSGSGDVYHSKEFKATLEETSESKNPEISGKNFWEKFLELNIQMGERSAEIRDDHPYDSRPLDWIQGKGRIFYWQNEEAKKMHPRTKKERQKFLENEVKNPEISLQNISLPSIWKYLFFTETDRDRKNIIAGRFRQKQEIHLFSNPLLWKMATLSTFFLLLFSLYFFRKNQKTPFLKNSEKAEDLGIIGFSVLLNILPFVFISRPEFLYHAFEGLVLAIIGMGLLFQVFLENFSSQKIQKFLRIFLLTSVTLYMAYFFASKLPIIYGFPFPASMSSSIIL